MVIAIDVYRLSADVVSQKKSFGAVVSWNENVSFPFEKTIDVFKCILGGKTLVKFNIE